MLGIFGQREVPTSPMAGLFFAFGAVIMAVQTFRSYRDGFMYCGTIDKVYRDRNPKKFIFWMTVQISFVLIMAVVSIYAFLH